MYVVSLDKKKRSKLHYIDNREVCVEQDVRLCNLIKENVT